MKKAKIEITIGNEELSDVVAANPIIAETKAFRNGLLVLKIITNISEAVGRIPGGIDELRSHPKVTDVVPIKQSSTRWYGGALVKILVAHDATFEQAVREVADVIAGVFNTVINISDQ